jgi:hypothetical protein
MNNFHLNKALSNYITEPRDSEYNFVLGKQYEEIGHLSAAISFYIRACEYGSDPLLIYESMLRYSLCIEKQGNRDHSLKGLLLRAISILPTRPEAYFLLGKVYERTKEWHEAYTLSIIGDTIVNEVNEPLRTYIDYPGKYVFTFQKAISGWWIGLWDESIYLLRQLQKRKDIVEGYRKVIDNNISLIGRSYKKAIKYYDYFYNDLRFKFNNSDKIKENYSQCYQDMFVLTMHNGKREGRFIEIGCDDAYFNSNTALLEKEFGWTGVSIDINEDKIKKFKEKRSSYAIAIDALKIDFKTLLTENTYDYLQIDCEPAMTSFQVLKRIPLDRCKFAVITFEHDNYCDFDKSIKEKSRRYLESYGYKMVVNNISEDRYSDFEDWWIHPDLVDNNIVEKMICISDDIKKADLYIFDKL